MHAVGARGIGVLGVLFALLFVALAAEGASAQHRWVEVKPKTPAPRWYEVAMAYDSRRRVTVMLGGRWSNAPGAPCEWDGEDWTARSPATVPYGTFDAMAYDPVTAGVIVVVTPAWNQPVATWSWDGFAWRLMGTRTTPQVRGGHSLVCDTHRRRVVLFGGNGAWTATNETWEWDGNAWTRLFPMASPPARVDHATAYDAARKEVVLFGGWSGGLRGDTWVWRSGTWVPMATTLHPPARWGHNMVYDSARQRVVLSGGYGASGYRSDTWEWDGVAWAHVSAPPRPEARRDAAMAYHAATGRILVFGGLIGDYPQQIWSQKTWEYRATHLTGTGTARPGAVVGLALESPGHTGAAFQAASSFDDGPIPVGAFSLGLQMDTLFWVSVTDALPQVFRGYRGRLDGTGRAAAAIAIPSVTALVGKTVHAAYVVIGPPAGGIVRAVSNTVRFTVQP